MQLQIRNLRHIQGNEILVETGKRENAEALLASDILKKAGLTVAVPQKKNPMIIIYDAPVMQDDSTIKAIIGQNATEE